MPCIDIPVVLDDAFLFLCRWSMGEVLHVQVRLCMLAVKYKMKSSSKWYKWYQIPSDVKTWDSFILVFIRSIRRLSWRQLHAPTAWSGNVHHTHSSPVPVLCSCVCHLTHTTAAINISAAWSLPLYWQMVKMAKIVCTIGFVYVSQLGNYSVPVRCEERCDSSNSVKIWLMGTCFQSFPVI